MRNTDSCNDQDKKNNLQIYWFATNATETNYCWEVNLKSRHEDKLFAYGLDEYFKNHMTSHRPINAIASLVLYSRAMN